MDDVQKLVEQICERFCFRDFLVRNPTFRKSSGLEREAADLLVPFRERLLAIQIKGFRLDVENVRSGVHQRRVWRRVLEATNQLKTINRALKTGGITEVTTARGITVPFRYSIESDVTGIVVVHLHGEDARTVAPLELPSLYFHRFGMPVHAFLAKDFSVVSAELDTLPDFLGYLDARAKLAERSAIPRNTHELDLLATYKGRHSEVTDFLSGSRDRLEILETEKSRYFLENIETLRVRDIRNRPSYIVDAVIEVFHKGIGFHAREEMPDGEFFDDDFEEGTIEGYLEVIKELASLKRLHRAALGEMLLERMRRAQTREFSVGVFQDPNSNVAFLGMATAAPRDKRRIILENVTGAASTIMRVDGIIGIATNELDSEVRSWDAIVGNPADVDPDVHPQLVELAKKLFKPTLRHERRYEFD